MVSGPRPAASRHPGVRGVTLVEVLVVTVLIAVMASAAVLGAGGVGSSRLRGAATLVVALSRLAATRANATGLPVRIVFDLGTSSISLEQSNTGRVLRSQDAEEQEPGGAAGATGAWVKSAEQASEQATELFLQGVTPPRPDFRPAVDVELDGEPMGTSRELGPGIEYRQVQTQHDEKPRTTGRAYLYFWPGGETEWASIQLKRSGKDEGLTVLFSPLNGRARIKNGNVDLPEMKDDGTISELEDPS